VSDDRSPPWPPPMPQPPSPARTATTSNDPTTRQATVDPLAKFYADRAERERVAAAEAAADAAAEATYDAAQQRAKEAQNAKLAKLEIERRTAELAAYKRAEDAKDAERSRLVQAAFAAEEDALRQRAEAQNAHIWLARVEKLEVVGADAKREHTLHVLKHVALALAVGAAAGLVIRTRRRAV
jgi:hypothetical protein